jgi:hypothetical protein
MGLFQAGFPNQQVSSFATFRDDDLDLDPEDEEPIIEVIMNHTIPAKEVMVITGGAWLGCEAPV